MKNFFKTIYIIDTILIYFILFMFLLWSVYHTLYHFPPKIEAIAIFFFVIFSFIALIQIILKKAKSYHLLESIVLPTTLIMSFLYFMIPLMVKAMPIFEKEYEKNGNSAINFDTMLASMELVMANQKELTFTEQLFILFSYETLPFMLVVIIILSINFIGNGKIYFSSNHPKQSIPNNKQGLL